MNILMCVNITRDLDMVLEEDWHPDSIGEIDIYYANQVIDFCDEGALELALRIMDKGDAQVDAVAVGDISKDRVLKNILALKVHNVTRIASEDILFDSLLLANKIVEFLNDNDYDLIIFGNENSISNDIQIGNLVSEMINIPCISDVVNFKVIDDCIYVEADEDDIIVSYTVKTPIIITVGNTINTHLRMITLNDKILAAKNNVKVFHAGSLFEQQKSQGKLKEMIRLDSKKECTFIEGENSAEKARKLYDEYLKKEIKL
jgi:electron transfer flavoprotein beta subunit